MTYSESTLQFAPMPKHARFIDLRGWIFGRLTVLGFAGSLGSSKMWFCRCECGIVTKVYRHCLMKGTSQSCGCLRRELLVIRQSKGGEIINGKPSVEYAAYRAARHRCREPNNAAFHNYGGRGIEFRFNTYREFLDEVGRRPSPAHSLERKDTNGHYERGNITWATPTEQSRNTRRNRLLTVGGVTKCTAQWAEELNIPAQRISTRLFNGACDECSISRQLRVSCPHK